MGRLDPLFKETNATLCYSCGRCTPACPLASYDKFSPRRFVERALTMNVVDEAKVWECLTCAGCSSHCPSSVDFPRLVRLLRDDSRPGAASRCAHAGILHSLMRLMATRDLRQDRLGWLSPDLQVGSEGDTLLFVGCAPYFDSYFDRWSPIGITRSAVRLLNKIGITPVVSGSEVCCGHDMLWSGEKETFQALANKNLALIEGSKAERVVFSCPECYSAFRKDYKTGAKVELKHITEVLAENMDKLEFKENGKRITYHDSCRMGRFNGVYDAPRKLLKSIPKLEVRELEHSREMSECCGTSCWMNCSYKSKNSQLRVLKEAERTSGALVTSCPKCLIHFNCAMDEKDRGPFVSVQDVIVTIDDSTAPRAGSGGGVRHG